MKVGDFLVELDGETFLAPQVGQQVGRQRAVVHVGARDHVRRGHHLAGVAALHEQRRPFGDLLVILGILHAAIAVMGAHRGVALLQEGRPLRADHEAHVRHGMDEIVRRGDGALLDQVGPELSGEVKFNIDLQRLGNIDCAIWLQGCVI